VTVEVILTGYKLVPALQVADILGIKEDAVYDLVRRGELEGKRIDFWRTRGNLEPRRINSLTPALVAHLAHDSA
jgi:hypothetical protein